MIEDRHLKKDFTIQRTVLLPRISDAYEADMICERPVEVYARDALDEEGFMVSMEYELKD